MIKMLYALYKKKNKIEAGRRPEHTYKTYRMTYIA